MGMCQDIAKSFMYVFTGLLGLLGLVILGTGAYVNSTFGEFDEMFTTKGVMIGLLCGAIVSLVSLLGFFGTKNQNKCFLFTFLVVLTLALFGQLVAGVSFLGYVGELDTVTAENADANKLSDANDIKINNFIYSVYSKCCYTDVCGSTTTDVCVPVYNCKDVPIKKACYKNNKNTAVFPLVPEAPYKISKDVCTVIKEAGFGCEKAKKTEAGVVDIYTPKLYQRRVYNYLKSKTKFFGYIAAVVGSIEILALIFTVVLICQNKDEFYDDDRV